MDSPSTQVLDDNDSSSSRSSESLQKTPKRVYQVATLTVGNKKYPIFEGINKVGRHLDNDICINDHNVSMYHAEIEADAKHAFICDLRSTNKTRMNDEKLKPDRFYQLLDGTKLTFGILNGTYLRLRDDESIIIPSTPEPGLKLRRESNKNSSRPNTSSTGDSDDSVVLGTQETPEAVFVKPLVPNRTINSKDTSNNDKININESDKSIYDEETQRTNKSIESQSFIHECATQKYDSKQSGRKNITTDNRQKAKKNIISVKSEIFDKETQKYRDKNNDTDESQISTQKLASEQNDQVYDAETQKISVNQQDNDLENAMTQKFNNKKIYDIETQKRNEFENQDNNNVYNMATQRFQPLNIRKEKTEIYDAETQQSKEKSKSDEEHEQDKVPVTDMVLRSNKNEEIMTTNKKKFGGQKNGKNTKKKEKETLGNYSRVDGESQELYFAHLNFKRKRKAVFDSQDSSDSERSNKYQKNSSGLKNDEPCLSGFVDGIAIVCERLDCQGLDETINHKETNDVNDDILTGLPEVNLNGAGFSPRSHASLNSSDEDIPNNEKKVLEQPKMISKSSGTKKLVLSIQCDNKINDNDEVNRKKTKIATVKLSQYDKKEKSSENSGKLSKSDEQIELDQKRIKKTPERKGQMNQSQVSKPELNSEVITSGYNSSSESKEVKIHEKRKAICDVSQSLIDSKKKKPVVRLDNSLNISLRQESKRKSFQVHKYCVIFTGINPEDYIESIKSLGGTVTDEPSKATVLVTDKVRRTYKFICAISRSIPIVSIKWIDECIEKDEFLDTDKYILKDDISEIKFDFKLSESLKKSSEGLLLLGYTFIITPKIVNPSIKDLKDMIQVAGGKSLIRMPRLWIPNTVIVGCDIDIPKIKEMVKKIPKNIEVPVVTTEFILSGILKQKLEPEVHKLY